MSDPWICGMPDPWIRQARSMDLVCQMPRFMDWSLLGQIQALGTKIASVANVAVGRVRSAQYIFKNNPERQILHPIVFGIFEVEKSKNLEIKKSGFRIFPETRESDIRQSG